MERNRHDRAIWDSERRGFADALTAAWYLLAGRSGTTEASRRSRAIAYLLELPEPVGLPGFFPFSEDICASFNRWKTAAGPGTRHWRRSGHGLDRLDGCPELLRYAVGTTDPTYLLRWDRDALRFALPTTMAVEALVSVGMARHPRVERAVKTLVALHDHPLCGAGADYRCCRPFGRSDLWVV